MSVFMCACMCMPVYVCSLNTGMYMPVYVCSLNVHLTHFGVSKANYSGISHKVFSKYI